jgi:glycosyltransferase involved in cell wall biosynthesis
MRLLILSPDAYSIFFPKTSFVFGGIEVETGYYARGLVADHGFEVMVVTRDQGRGIRRVEGVTVVPHPELKGPGYWDWRRSLAGRIHHRIFGERQRSNDAFYTSLRPDVAYVQGMVAWTLNTARYCRKTKTPFLFRVASDLDLGNDTVGETPIQQWAGFSLAEAREVIDSAASILVQTPVQMTLLRERFGRIGTLLFNPVAPVESPSKASSKKYDVLWIGKSWQVKRPDLLLKLAGLLPEKKFCMVLNQADKVYWNQLAAALPSNIDMIEMVPFREIGKLFDQARLFVSTADSEGFANTFLQAAAHGVPILSMNSDPNGMLSEHGAGLLTGVDINVLVGHIRKTLADGSQYDTFSIAGRRYVEKYHDARIIVSQFSEACRSLHCVEDSTN